MNQNKIKDVLDSGSKLQKLDTLVQESPEPNATNIQKMNEVSTLLETSQQTDAAHFAASETIAMMQIGSRLKKTRGPDGKFNKELAMEKLTDEDAAAIVTNMKALENNYMAAGKTQDAERMHKNIETLQALPGSSERIQVIEFFEKVQKEELEL